METYSALLAFCAGNSPVPGEFPSQRPVTRSVDVSLIYAWINGWVNNREVCDLWRHRSRYDVIVMISMSFPCRNNNVPPWIFQCTALLFDITWTPWHLKSPVIRIFFKSAFRLTTNKTKKHHCLPKACNLESVLMLQRFCCHDCSHALLLCVTAIGTNMSVR